MFSQGFFICFAPFVVDLIAFALHGTITRFDIDILSLLGMYLVARSLSSTNRILIFFSLLLHTVTYHLLFIAFCIITITNCMAWPVHVFL